MLTIQTADSLIELRCDTYYIQTEWDGADNTLHIQLPARHPQALLLAERTRIYESDSGQVYALSKYNRGKSSTDITAELDLDELCVGMVINWSNTSGNAHMTLGATITAVLPSGWTLVDNTGRTDTQEIDSFCGNPLDLITEAVALWGDVSEVGVQYDNAKRTVTLCSPGKLDATSAYYTEDLNLLETPTVKYSAERGDYYTRLYMTGADGLTLPSPGYVECKTYDDRTISAYLSDESIEDAAALQAYAQKTVNAAAKVDRSYTCKIVDLAKLNPDKYGWLTSPIYSSIILIDREDQSRGYQTVQRVKTWPHYPEKNEVTLSTVPGTLSSTAQRVYSLARNTANATTAAQSTASDATAKLALWSDKTDSNKIAGGQVATGTVSGTALSDKTVTIEQLSNGTCFTLLYTNSSTNSNSGFTLKASDYPMLKAAGAVLAVTRDVSFWTEAEMGGASTLVPRGCSATTIGVDKGYTNYFLSIRVIGFDDSTGNVTVGPGYAGDFGGNTLPSGYVEKNSSAIPYRIYAINTRTS